MPVRIGTRGSSLALVQAKMVATALERNGIDCEVVPMATQGDLVRGVPLHEIGGQGVFVRALDEALLEGRIDCAVHSMKDIPAKRPRGLVTSAILKRDPPGDFLVHSLPDAEVRVIGTSSTRRKAQLLRYRKGASIGHLRGNVDTRLRRLREGQFDAIVLAHAGICRLGLSLPGEPLSTDIFVPSPNQGTIAVVSRDEEGIVTKLSPLDDADTRRDIMVERTVMEELGGGCFTPLGVFSCNGRVVAEVLSLDGNRAERSEGMVTGRDDTVEFARELLGRSRGLISDAYEKLGISHGG
jgi:hydroxymethylbilane synthase